VLDTVDRPLEDLINDVDCDVALMRAPDDWQITTVKRVLVPVGGRGEEQELRARLLGTLCREQRREVVFLTVVPTTASEDELAAALRQVTRLAEMKIPMTAKAEVVRSDDPIAAILEEAARSDLLVLGLRKSRQGRKMLGSINRRLAVEAPCAVMLLSRRAQASISRPIATVIPWTPRRADETQ
jgi:hypothetical protein